MRDEDVPDYWRSLGLPGLVDVHTHFMPANVLAKVWDHFDRAGPLVGRAWPITYRGDESVRLHQLRSMGARRFTSLLYPHKPDMASWLNTWAAGFVARTPDCVHSATFFPEPGAGEYVRAAIEAGARVFKAHVQVGGYDLGEPLLDEVWQALSDSGTPVVAHVGSGPVPGRRTGPEPVRRLLRRHPSLQVVIAHLGMPEYEEFLGLAERYDGVHLDTTMAFTDFAEELAPFPRQLLPRLRDAGSKVLFGSDFPNIPYGYGHQLEALARLELGDDWMRAVLWQNGARMFGVPAVVITQ